MSHELNPASSPGHAPPHKKRTALNATYAYAALYPGLHVVCEVHDCVATCSEPPLALETLDISSAFAPHRKLHAHKLPHDVLCDIFYTCASVCIPNSHDLGWIRISHVCRSWRLTLIDSLPNLWARLVCLYPNAFDTLLSRAKSAPLNLDYEHFITRVDAERFWGLVPRARSIVDAQDRVWFKHYCHWEVLLPGQTLDRIQELEVLGVPHLGRIQLYPEQSRLPRGDMVYAPALRQLRLRSISLSFHAPLLRVLKIERHHANLDAKPPLPKLLAMLSSYPLLEDITLLHATHPTPDDQAEQLAEDLDLSSLGPNHPIDFPCMAKLRLSGHPRELATLWRSIAVPHMAVVRFELALSRAVPESFLEQLLDVASAHFATPRNDSLSLRSSASQLYRTEVVISPAGGIAPGSCVFEIVCRVPPHVFRRLSAHTLSAFVHTTVPHVRALHLTNQLPELALLEFAPPASPLIRTLHLRGPGLGEQETLAALIRGRAFPGLEVVELHIEHAESGRCGTEMYEALRTRGRALPLLVLHGRVRYVDREEQRNELEALQDVVETLVDEREWEIEDDSEGGGKTRKLAGLGIALLLSSVTLLQV